MGLTVPIIMRSIQFYIVYLDDSALLQCTIGLISEVIAISIVIGIVNPIPYTLVSVTFCSLILSFIPKGFCDCVTGTEATET